MMNKTLLKTPIFKAFSLPLLYFFIINGIFSQELETSINDGKLSVTISNLPNLNGEISYYTATALYPDGQYKILKIEDTSEANEPFDYVLADQSINTNFQNIFTDNEKVKVLLTDHYENPTPPGLVRILESDFDTNPIVFNNDPQIESIIPEGQILEFDLNHELIPGKENLIVLSHLAKTGEKILFYHNEKITNLDHNNLSYQGELSSNIVTVDTNYSKFWEYTASMEDEQNSDDDHENRLFYSIQNDSANCLVGEKVPFLAVITTNDLSRSVSDNRLQEFPSSAIKNSLVTANQFIADYKLIKINTLGANDPAEILPKCITKCVAKDCSPYEISFYYTYCNEGNDYGSDMKLKLHDNNDFFKNMKAFHRWPMVNAQLNFVARNQEFSPKGQRWYPSISTHRERWEFQACGAVEIRVTTTPKGTQAMLDSTLFIMMSSGFGAANQDTTILELNRMPVKLWRFDSTPPPRRENRTALQMINEQIPRLSENYYINNNYGNGLRHFLGRKSYWYPFKQQLFPSGCVAVCYDHSYCTDGFFPYIWYKYKYYLLRALIIMILLGVGYYIGKKQVGKRKLQTNKKTLRK